MNKKWSVHLKLEEQSELESIVKKGKSSARMIKRAQTLLFANEGKQDQEIASLLRCGVSSVYCTRRAYCKHGLKQSLNEKARSERPEKLAGRNRIFLVRSYCRYSSAHQDPILQTHHHHSTK